MKNLLTEVLAPKYELPAGYDTWGLKSVRPDLSTSNGFRYPWPGNETGRFVLDDHDSPCPKRVGDGLCVAATWQGMASGGFPARTLLLVAYRAREARGDVDKVRTAQVSVVDVVDGERLLKEHGAGAYLSGANLSGADLSGANLSRADLTGADLYGADLYGADLAGADLYGANLSRAYLSGANLSGADLTGADLSRANLYGADLAGAVGVEKGD